METEELRQRIWTYRAKHNIFQEEMAKLLGVGYVTLSDFMNGKKETKKYVLARMKVKLDELEGRD